MSANTIKYGQCGPFIMGVRELKTIKLNPFLLAVVLVALSSPASALHCAPEKLTGLGTVDLAQFRGRIVYVDYWASWCASCKQSFPFMNDLKKQFESKGVTVVAISTDKDSKEALEFLNDNKADFIVARDTDSKCRKEFGVKTMPSSYILGKNGELLHTHKSFVKSDIPAITKELQALVDKN